jgi:uncharacterized protein
VLTADLVTVRRRGGELRLSPTDGPRRAQIEALATTLQAVAKRHVGRARDEVDGALEAATADLGGDRRMAAAVVKLVRDACRFEEPDAQAATELRREIFSRAAAARQNASPLAPFDRTAVLAEAALALGKSAAEIEAALFADRAAATRLLAVEAAPPAAVAAGFELAEAQAVLLRATKVRATVRAQDATTYRHLFRSLKFLRLLPVIAPRPPADPGYVIELDGPLSLFDGNTRYGLALGLALPAIASCDAWQIDADVRWGADRRPLHFQLEGKAVAAPPSSASSPELEAFVAAFERLPGDWRVDREPAILDLPGVGLCVPDLTFVRDRDGARVFFELLGFWSREAVWRRVELARAGLPHRILFAASRSLRVGEAVLDDVPHAALYVFGRTPNAKAVLGHLDRLA